MYQGNQKRKIRTKILYISLVPLIVFFVSPNVWGKDKRNPTSLQSDFEGLAGSYKLEKGNANCPDGEFSVSDKNLTIGANIRIINVNGGVVKESASSQSACSTESKADFDGKTLVYKDIEECSKTSRSEALYRFEIYQSNKTKYIKMKFNKTSKISGQTSTFTFECLYSRDVK